MGEPSTNKSASASGEDGAESSDIGALGAADAYAATPSDDAVLAASGGRGAASSDRVILLLVEEITAMKSSQEQLLQHVLQIKTRLGLQGVGPTASSKSEDPEVEAAEPNVSLDESFVPPLARHLHSSPATHRAQDSAVSEMSENSFSSGRQAAVAGQELSAPPPAFAVQRTLSRVASRLDMRNGYSSGKESYVDVSDEAMTSINLLLPRSSGAEPVRFVPLCARVSEWCDKHFPPMHPDSKLSRALALVSTMMMIYTLIFLPIALGFHTTIDPDGSALVAVHLLVDALCIIRLAARAHTGVYDRGVYVGTTREVFELFSENKLKLLLEIISCFPYTSVALSLAPGSLERRLFQMMRVMYALVPACTSLTDTFRTGYKSSIHPAFVRVGMMGLWLLCSAHWFGCLWWLVGVEQESHPHDPDNVPWGPSAWLLEQEFGMQYFHAFLWGIGMMTTQLPYDVQPSTALEVAVTVISTLTAMIISSFTTSSITSVLSSIDSRDSAYRAQLATLMEYMRFKGVDQKTAHRIIEFYHHGHSTSFKEILSSPALPRLPYELSAELHAQLYRCLIRNCPIFDTTKFPVQVVIELLHQLEPVIGVPLQLIVQEGRPNSNLFIIERGSLRVWKDFMNPEKRCVLRVLRDNDHFGERSIFAAWEKGGAADVATATCECVGFCDMLKLDFTCFAATLESYGLTLKYGAETIKKLSIYRDLKRKAHSHSSSGSDAMLRVRKSSSADKCLHLRHSFSVSRTHPVRKTDHSIATTRASEAESRTTSGASKFKLIKNVLGVSRVNLQRSKALST